MSPATFYSGVGTETLLGESLLHNSEFLKNKGFKELAIELVIGHKLANKLRLSVLTHNERPNSLSVFGIDSTYAFNHIQWSDHGLDHVRRMHRLIDMLIGTTPQLVEKIKKPIFLYALELFPYFHDLDQLLTLMDNNIQKGEAKSKQGHALAGAVMIMALTDKYMRSAGMDESELASVEQITATAAIMMIKHDEPEKLDKALSRVNKITGEDLKKLSDDELFDDFVKNKLDLFSLSRSQIMKILLRMKSGNTEYGLYGEFAREYKPVLEKMKNDNRPLSSNSEESDIETVQILTHIAVLADKIDMMYPPFPSIIRLLNTKISQGRGWWDSNISSDEMFELIDKKDGNYDGEGECDVRRLLWQALDSAKQFKKNTKNPIDSNRYINDLSMEHSLMSILALQEFGEGIMGADSSSTVEKIYQERLKVLGQKVLKRLGSDEEYKNFDDTIKSITDSNYEFKDLLIDRFQFRVRSLSDEAEQIKKLVKEKKGLEKIEDFRSTCDEVLKEVCNIFSIEIDGAEIVQLKNKIHSEANEFYSTYDSLGGTPDIWGEPINIEHYEIWNNLINGYIHGPNFYRLRTNALKELEI